jgi:diadenosine tetraphosphate (Ap4A) HIT family hydrolase
MPTAIHARVRAAQAGESPSAICRMPSGWAVMGDSQLLRGYCLLLSDPVVPDLNALTGKQRAQFLSDMAIIGDALLEVTGAVRCNYEILGNQDPALHAHIFPRFTNEPEEYRTLPPMFYPAEQRSAIPFDPTRDRELMNQIAEAINKRP